MATIFEFLLAAILISIYGIASFLIGLNTDRNEPPDPE